MNDQEIFDYLKANLTLRVNRDYGSYGGSDYYDIEVVLVNPSTGKAEVISTESVRID